MKKSWSSDGLLTVAADTHLFFRPHSLPTGEFLGTESKHHKTAVSDCNSSHLSSSSCLQGCWDSISRDDTIDEYRSPSKTLKLSVNRQGSAASDTCSSYYHHHTSQQIDVQTAMPAVLLPQYTVTGGFDGHTGVSLDTQVNCGQRSIMLSSEQGYDTQRLQSLPEELSTVCDITDSDEDANSHPQPRPSTTSAMHSGNASNQSPTSMSQSPVEKPEVSNHWRSHCAAKGSFEERHVRASRASFESQTSAVTGSGSMGSLATISEPTSPSHDSTTMPSDKTGTATPQGEPHHHHHLTDGPAAMELFLRLNHARQTVDFVKRQAAQFSHLDKAHMTVWDSLSLLNTLREFEAAMVEDDSLDPTMPLMEHALQTAEACRLAYPDEEWLHVVGLIHGLGKLLAHKNIGSQPQWAICGESFPVGCRFSPAIGCSQFFSVNPDRRRRIYNTATGIYQRGCGLKSVFMSWSACEYLYMVLVLNGTKLPDEALFVLRYQNFHSLLVDGSYSELLSREDYATLPWLERFRELAKYQRRDLPGMLQGEELKAYYNGLLKKYNLGGDLMF